MKLIILNLILCFICFNLAGQDFDLLATIDDQLVKINSSSNAIEVVGDINPSPADLVRFLTFVEEDCLIYGIIYSGSNPTLVSIDMDLNFSVIGSLTMPGNSIYFCEGLSFNNTDNTLYGSVSINGNQSGGDYFSETIVEVNKFSATCLYKTEIIGNVSFPDIDRMAFCDNILYFFDGDPGSNWGKFFELDFSSLGVTAQALELTSVAYSPVKDLECLYGNIYFSTGRDLSILNTASYNITNLGNLFSLSDFGGEEITGLSINPFPDLRLGDDISICDDDYLLEIDYPFESMNWNNGSTGNSILIIESGLYWADVVYNNCTFRTDTIDVTFVFPLDINLGGDTTICGGESIYFTIDEPNVEVIWSDGTIGTEIEISESGSYWFQYMKEECTFFTDTIYVDIVDGEYDIGPDISLCEGESYTLNLEGVGQNINWSNGEIGNQLEINEEGVYWAEIFLNNCQFITNSINVNIVPIENIEIGSDTVLCGVEDITLSVLNPTSNYQWNTGEVGESIVVIEEGTYWAASIGNDCPSLSNSVEVRFVEDPNVTFNIDTLLCVEEELDFSNTIFDIEWKNNEGEILTFISESGNYIGSYQVDQCIFETDSLKVEFVDCTPCTYYIPNIISPNQDGINDDFEVIFTTSCNVLDFEISIFDRWGNLIHKSKDNYWNGKFNSVPVVNGVFLYSIKMSFAYIIEDVQEITLFGDVTVLK